MSDAEKDDYVLNLIGALESRLDRLEREHMTRTGPVDKRTPELVVHPSDSRVVVEFWDSNLKIDFEASANCRAHRQPDDKDE